MKVEVICSNGPARKGGVYEVLDRGYDWYCVRLKGKPFYIDRDFCRRVPDSVESRGPKLRGGTEGKFQANGGRKISKYRSVNNYPSKMDSLYSKEGAR